MANNKNNFDMAVIVSNAEKIKAKKANKEKKPSVSLRPLKFEISEEDSALKKEIIRLINEKDLTYSDIYAYYTEKFDGDISEGQKKGYNTIFGLKNRHSMIDTTFSELCDFLGLDIYLKPKKPIETDDDDLENDEESN